MTAPAYLYASSVEDDADVWELDEDPERPVSPDDADAAERWASVVVVLRMGGMPLLDAISMANAYELEDGDPEPVVAPPVDVPEPPQSVVRVVPSKRAMVLAAIRSRPIATIDDLTADLPSLTREAILGATSQLLKQRKISGTAKGYRALDISGHLPQRVVSALSRHPDGLDFDGVREALGGRVTNFKLSGVLGWLRRAGRVVRSGGVYRIS